MNAKKLLALLLAVVMVLGVLAGCQKDNAANNGGNNNETQGNTPNGDTLEIIPFDVSTVKEGDFTYRAYTTALGDNWNPHSWETNADDAVLSYLETPLATMSIKDSENGVYQWVFQAATSVTDVTAANKADLTKYNVTLPEGQTAEETEKGFVFEIKLNENMKWENGTPINADTYIYSMKALLDPAMKNYRANLYYSGESAVAGGELYYFAGSTATLDNNDTGAFAALTDLVKGEDGVYTTPDGSAVWFNVGCSGTYVGGSMVEADEYYTGYGYDIWEDASFEALKALMDENGKVAVTDESWALMVTTINTADWGNEDESCVPGYMSYEKTYAECEYDSTVGCYKVDDYTIRYVTQAQIDYNYFLTSCTSNWLVYEDLYEAGKDTTGTLVTTDYGTSIDTTMSYGPYKMESLQEGKQMVFVRNENWYNYKTTESGYIYACTDYAVDGAYVQQYQTTKVVIDVMEEETAQLAFMKGELTEWAPPADQVPTYAASSQMYKVDETYTMSFFFNTDVDALKAMDETKGNTNSVVLSNINFRKAFSLAIDRADWVESTEGYKPAFALMNNLYFYDVYNDPESRYRSSEQAMKAIVDLYGVEYGEGTPYADLKAAHDSINGYNLTEAKNLMATACAELVAAGLYTEGEDIVIRIGYKKGTIESTEEAQIAKFNSYINAAVEGSGFGKITLEAIGNITDRYGDVAKGEFAIGYGAWGGAAFYPFRNMQVYCDTEQYEINEAACWDPATETLTVKINGEDVTMTWQDWSRALVGSGPYANADFETKLDVTAAMELEYLKKYYRIPLAGTCIASLLSYQAEYYTDEYNIMYGFGGMELMTYALNDAEWAEYVAGEGGELNYE